MKNELLLGKTFHDIGEVIAAVAVAVDFYNNRHPHMSIGMMTSAQASETSGDRDMKWTSHRLLAIKSRNSDGVTEKTLPLQLVSGLLPACGLQSTTDRDKTRMVNSFQD